LLVRLASTKFGQRILSLQQCAVLRERFFVFPASLVVSVSLLAAESLHESIDFLLAYVANSNATFIRNGSEHTPIEAVDHIKAKYAHFKDQIKTPEDFIRLCASKSLLSGKPYLVRPLNGKEMRLDAWLEEALKIHRAALHSE